MTKSVRPAALSLRRACFALTALLALFAISASRADAAPWSAPENVSVPGGGASGSRVGMDATGDATAVWTRSDGLHFYAQSAERPLGGSWGAPVDLSGAVGEAESPAVAVDDAGDVVAAWKERLPGSEAIETNYKPAGGSWEVHVAVEIGAAVVETPAVAIDDAGDAVVIWRQEVGGNHVIFAASRQPGGSWAPPVAISSSALDAEAPDVAMSAEGTAAAVWHSSSGATSVVESNTLPLGGSWTGEEAISAPATETEPPQVVPDNGGGFAAVWSRSGVGRPVEFSSTPPGGPWNAPQVISGPGVEAQAPQLAIDSGGDAVAAWNRHDGGVPSIEATSISVSGGSWGSPVRISPVNAEEAEAPQVVISAAGASQVAWSSWNPATHNYVTRTSRLPANGTWQASNPVSVGNEEAYGPHIALDHGGHTVVVWNGEVPVAAAEIKSSFRDETTPLAVTKSGSGSGTVTSGPAGIDCGTTCAARFLEESTVNLTASPAAGSRFVGWSGACAGSGSCTVEIGESQSSVDAEFESTATGGGGTKDETSPIPTATATPTPTAAPPTCTVAAPASVGTFAPTPKPGSVVPGIRVKVGVEGPSSVGVTATLTYGGGKARRIGLGTVAYHGSGFHKLRFALPTMLRAQLPPGSAVRVALAVTAKPDSAVGCASPGAVTHKLKLKVVKVLSGPQSGVS